MDSQPLVEMLEGIENEDFGQGIEGLVIVRNGAVVLEATVFPFSRSPSGAHNVYSCTKSVISILIGIAIDQGYIVGVDQSVLDFFPDRDVDHVNADKESLTLEHLLTMTTGLDCRDSYLYRWRGLNQMRSSGDWVQFMLDLPMIETPGTRFEYCNGASFLLSAILQETTGMSAEDFANEHLFSPLGISDLSWDSNPLGITIGYSDLHLMPEDLGKIGQLMLNGGQWDDEQILSAEWIQESTSFYIDATLQDGYGYQWWVDVPGTFMALGYGGQYLIVVPEEQLVVAFVSDLPEEAFYLPQRLLETYILPAIRSSEPLPENPQATTLISLYKQALADP